MGAVGYRIRRLLRAHWRSTAALTVTVATVLGLVLAFAAGARRTATAPDRFTAAFGGEADGRVEQQAGPPRTKEVAGLPGVSAVDAVTFVFGGLLPERGGPPAETLVFAGSHRAFGTRLADGREPDPAEPGEFAATRSFVEANHASLGDHFRLAMLSQEQADRAGFDAFAAEEPRGGSVDAVLVGIVDGPTELQDPTPLTAFSPALLDAGTMGVSATVMAVTFRPGTDLALFRAQLDTLPDGEALGLERERLVPAEVRTAVEAQSRGTWVLAAVAAVAAVAVLGQLFTRSVRLPQEEARRLAAVGGTRNQLLAESVGRAAVPIVAGAVLATAVATAISTFFPAGFVRRIEPGPGVQFDAAVLLPAAGTVVGALLAWVLVSLVLGAPAKPLRPAPLVEAAAARSRSAAFATGLRFAFTRAQLDRGSVRGAIVGVITTCALLFGTLVFGSGLSRLVSDGARYGITFDLASGTGGDAVPDDLRTRLEADSDVQGLTLYAAAEVRSGALSLGLAGMQRVKGNEVPVTLTGRLPSSDDEIAPGRLAAADLDARVGDDVVLEGEGRRQRFRVTGIVVVPGVEGLDGVGEDALVTLGGLRRLSPEATPSVAAVAVRPGAVVAAIQRYGIGPVDPPAVIITLTRIRSIPYLLAAILGALALMTVVHVMVTSVRNRRRDIAVLRSVGADGPWITRTVHWQATTFALVTMVLGAPLGLIVGRIVFKLFVDSVGAVPDASYPFVVLGLVLFGFVVVANLVAAVPAWRARRLSPAPLLVAE
jgi:hypothetical protein